MGISHLSTVLAATVCFSFGGFAEAQDRRSVKPSDPQEALKQIMADDLCSSNKAKRTSKMSLTNSTALGVNIVFMQAVSTNPAPNPDFVTDSGVFVASTGLGSGQTIESDPCYAGGSAKPVQANICKATVQMEDGQEPKLADQNSGAVPYFNECGWELSLAAADAQGKRIVIMRRAVAK